MHDAGAVQDGASVVVRVPNSALARSKVFCDDDGRFGQAGEGCAGDAGELVSVKTPIQESQTVV